LGRKVCLQTVFAVMGIGVVLAGIFKTFEESRGGSVGSRLDHWNLRISGVSGHTISAGDCQERTAPDII
ncbi:hypothetical protein PoB_001857100, partial [Plakobranchus ocellatus]